MSTPPPEYPEYLDYPEDPEYPPPGYHHPGYPPAGYPPPGYGPPWQTRIPGAYQPAIIPLRPLNLTDIVNGAVNYIRANPKTTLGLTAAVVVLMQLVALIVKAGPLITAAGAVRPLGATSTPGAVSTAVSVLVSWLAGIPLTGMLTVIIGRAVFGLTISIGEAWAKVRGRLFALIGLAALEIAGALLLVGLVVLIIVTIALAGNDVATVLLSLPLILTLIATLVYLYTVLSFAPVLIVLERLPVMEAIARSFTLVHNSFWRVLGIRLLAAIVVFIITEAVAAPLTIVDQLMATTASTGLLLMGTTLLSIGEAIGQIVTTPFSAGVVVLLYTDRRIRTEAFPPRWQTGFPGGPATAWADNLWLTRPISRR